MEELDSNKPLSLDDGLELLDVDGKIIAVVGMPCRTEPAGLWVKAEPAWCASIVLRNEPLLESLFAKHLGAQEQ